MEIQSTLYCFKLQFDWPLDYWLYYDGSNTTLTYAEYIFAVWEEQIGFKIYLISMLIMPCKKFEGNPRTRDTGNKAHCSVGQSMSDKRSIETSFGKLHSDKPNAFKFYIKFQTAAEIKVPELRGKPIP